jgi:hypothetical protein
MYIQTDNIYTQVLAHFNTHSMDAVQMLNVGTETRLKQKTVQL